MDRELADMTDVYWLEQVEVDLPAEDDWLSSAELSRLKSMRIAKRRNDWRLGRWTAKRALATYLDLPTDTRTLAKFEILPAPSGAPEAFFTNHPAPVSISISHRVGTAICALAAPDTFLGCDLELIETRDENFVADYFTPEEQARIAEFPLIEQPLMVTLLWSAKESALKALHVGLQEDTRNVTVTFAHARYACDRNNPVPTFDRRTWQALQVRHSDGRIFRGWWQNTDFVRTVVSSRPPLPPTALYAN
jgi:4'-phosphopantetheinyl transferase